MLILNFPANPTAQCVELRFLRADRRARASEHGIYVVHDLAYADIVFDGWKAPSIMQVPGAQRRRGRVLHDVEELQHGGLAHRLHGRQPRSRQRARAHQELSRLRHVHADPGRRDRGARRRRRSASSEIAAQYQQRRDVLVQGAARGGLDGRHAEGVDVRLGEDSRAVSRSWARSSSRRSCWPRRRCRCRRASASASTATSTCASR